MERKEVVAFLIDATADSFMSYKDYGPAGAAVVGPDGRKHVFTAEQLAKAELAMGMTETLASLVGEQGSQGEGEPPSETPGEAKKTRAKTRGTPARGKPRRKAR